MIQFADGIDSIGHGYCFSIHFWNVWFLIFSISLSLSIVDVIIICQQLNFNYTKFVPSIRSFSIGIDGLHVTRFVCLISTSIFWQRNWSSRNNLISSYINKYCRFFRKMLSLTPCINIEKRGKWNIIKNCNDRWKFVCFYWWFVIATSSRLFPTSAKRDSYAFFSSLECVD